MAHKRGASQQKKRDKFRALHPEGRKEFAKQKRKKRLEKQQLKHLIK